MSLLSNVFTHDEDPSTFNALSSTSVPTIELCTPIKLANSSTCIISSPVAPYRIAFCICSFNPGVYICVAHASNAQYTSSFSLAERWFFTSRKGSAENS
jgi:hypothetical protein